MESALFQSLPPHSGTIYTRPNKNYSMLEFFLRIELRPFYSAVPFGLFFLFVFMMQFYLFQFFFRFFSQVVTLLSVIGQQKWRYIMALYIITIKLLTVAQISNNKSYLNKCNQLDPNFSEPTAKTQGEISIPHKLCLSEISPPQSLLSSCMLILNLILINYLLSFLF